LFDGLLQEPIIHGAVRLEFQLRVAFPLVRLFSGDIKGNSALSWKTGKLAASAFVAASAVLIFLIGIRFVSPVAAAALALAYGLGTCAWSVSSQGLWQHGPNEFFICLGTFMLARSILRPWNAALCGASFAAAVLCRPDSAFFVIAVGVYLLVVDRKGLLWFMLGGFPMAMALGLYNLQHLNSWWSLGQATSGEEIALYKTGSRDLWQTPLLVGLIGKLLSPSRGLFVFSPFLIFSLWGGAAALRDRQMRFV
jgi:hypothetical protein